MKTAVLLVVLLLALNAAALRLTKADLERFDWNHYTAASGIKPMAGADMPAPRTLWTGVMANTYPGGHNFGTRRALDLVIAKARTNKDYERMVLKVLKEKTLDDLARDRVEKKSMFSTALDQPTAMKMLTYGNFQNELRVNIDGTGAGPAAAAFLIRKLFGSDREITPNGKNSAWWTAETGYSSANPIHSMHAEAATPNPKYTQARSFDQLIAFVKTMIAQAVSILRAEKDSPTQTENWKKGIRSIGSVLHVIQDSACYCSPRHKTIQPVPAPLNKEVKAGDLSIVRTCLPGDGHGVVSPIGPGGRFLVTGLSDTNFYGHRLHHHEQLDKLYERGRVLDVNALATAKSRADINRLYNAQPNVLWGDNDPAYDGGNLILDVIRAVFTRDPPSTVATNLCNAHVQSRFVGRTQLKMPALDPKDWEK